MRTLKYWLASATVVLSFCFEVMASDGESDRPAFLAESKISLDTRLRYESAHDEIQTDADALTLRGALTWKTGPLVPDTGWSGLIQIEHTSVLSPKNYTSGAQDRGTVLIADLAGTEVNQLYVAYESPRGFAAKIGRQSISFGDERFVGKVRFARTISPLTLLVCNTRAPKIGSSTTPTSITLIEFLAISLITDRQVCWAITSKIRTLQTWFMRGGLRA